MRTKLNILLLLFTIFCSQFSGFAQYKQEDYYNRLLGGLTAGANFTRIDGVGYKDNFKWGFSGGGILYLTMGDVDLPFPGTLAFSIEVLYNQKGAIGKGRMQGGILSQSIDLKYAEIPIQINLFRGTRKSNFGMGFAFGYLGYQEELIETENDLTIKNAHPFKKLDLSYVITGNIHLWNGFYLSPRFQYSLISIRNNNGRFGGRNEQFNNVWSLRLMYLFK